MFRVIRNPPDPSKKQIFVQNPSLWTEVFPPPAELFTLLSSETHSPHKTLLVATISILLINKKVQLFKIREGDN